MKIEEQKSLGVFQGVIEDCQSHHRKEVYFLCEGEIEELGKHYRDIVYANTDFDWGFFRQSGMMQLAFSMVLTTLQLYRNDLTEKERVYLSRRIYQFFSWDVISKFQTEKGWEMDSLDIMTYITENEAYQKFVEKER
jgi:hypothetical protein